MKAKQIALILIPLNIILAYFVFNSIDSEVEFQKIAKVRITENVQKLKDLRQLQIAYKKVNNTYASNFELLLDFLENDSMVIVKAIGETPDSLTDAQALELEIISRDTAYVLAKKTVFDDFMILTNINGCKVIKRAYLVKTLEELLSKTLLK